MIQSTNPFRRAGSLLLANLYLFGMGIYFNICEYVARLTDSEFHVDYLESPITFRARRVLRNRKVHLRELEFQLKQSRYELEKSKIDTAVEDSISESVSAKIEAHRAAIKSWTWDFEEDVREQQQALEAAERAEKAIRDAENAKMYEQRVLEAKVAEEARQAAYKAQRELELKSNASFAESDYLAELRRREEEYNRLNPNGSYGDRLIATASAGVRALPSTEVAIRGYLQQYALISVDGWINSEIVQGNSIWFRIKASNFFPEGGWIWSGSLNNLSTSGLQDLNEEPDVTTIRSGDGTVVQQYVSPTPMQDKIEAHKRQNNASFYQPNRPSTRNRKEGDLWYDTLNNNELYRFDGVGWILQSTQKQTRIWDGGITSSHITAGSINADKIVIGGNGISVHNGDGQTLAQITPKERLETVNSLADKVAQLEYEKNKLTRQAITAERDAQSARYAAQNAAVAAQMHNVGMNIALGGMYDS